MRRLVACVPVVLLMSSSVYADDAPPIANLGTRTSALISFPVRKDDNKGILGDSTAFGIAVENNLKNIWGTFFNIRDKETVASKTALGDRLANSVLQGRSFYYFKKDFELSQIDFVGRLSRISRVIGEYKYLGYNQFDYSGSDTHLINFGLGKEYLIPINRDSGSSDNDVSMTAKYGVAGRYLHSADKGLNNKLIFSLESGVALNLRTVRPTFKVSYYPMKDKIGSGLEKFKYEIFFDISSTLLNQKSANTNPTVGNVLEAIYKKLFWHYKNGKTITSSDLFHLIGLYNDIKQYLSLEQRAYVESVIGNSLKITDSLPGYETAITVAVEKEYADARNQAGRDAVLIRILGQDIKGYNVYERVSKTDFEDKYNKISGAKPIKNDKGQSYPDIESSDIGKNFRYYADSQNRKVISLSSVMRWLKDQDIADRFVTDEEAIRVSAHLGTSTRAPLFDIVGGR